MLPIALPSTYQNEDVIPYAPNVPGDRGHTWDWAGHLETMPSGASIGTVDAAQGTETITLGYVGLTRSAAKTLEAFVSGKAGRHDGFWCPTFQHDFHVVDGLHYSVNGNLVVRDWGFLANVFPLTANGIHWPYNIAAYRGGSWFLTNMTGATFDAGTFDETGARLVGYNLNYNAGYGGSTSVINANDRSDRQGIMCSRLLWVRFADDAITTEWDHPHLASVTLRVQHLRLETPFPS